MIENSGRVERVEGGDAWILAERPVGCGHCHENPACSVNRDAAGGDAGASLVRVSNGLGARPGERVVVGVPDGAVFHVALLVYLIPMALALAGALLAVGLGGDDLLALVATAAGLALGYVWARRSERRLATRRRCAPTILRRLA